MIRRLKNIFFPERSKLGAMLAKGAIIIDVRSPGEFDKGHAKDAINIPLHTIPRNIEKIKSYNKPVVVCCALGMRSARATGKLQEAGIDAFSGGLWRNVASFQ